MKYVITRALVKFSDGTFDHMDYGKQGILKVCDDVEKFRKKLRNDLNEKLSPLFRVTVTYIRLAYEERPDLQ